MLVWEGRIGWVVGGGKNKCGRVQGGAGGIGMGKERRGCSDRIFALGVVSVKVDREFGKVEFGGGDVVTTKLKYVRFEE